MANFSSFNNQGLNLQLNPLTQNQGEFLQLINVDPQPFGAKTKRPGYSTYLSSLGARVDTLFDWHRNNGTQFWNYAAAGGTLFSSEQGTGAWVVTGNGTVTDGTIFHNVLEDTLVITSPTGTTRHSANGTSFTDTTAAPIGGVGVIEYQNRIWIPGTSSNLFYSTTGTPTDWTSDSSSIAIPGAGRLLSGFKSQDRLITTKNSGLMSRWDGFSLVDLATDLGPTSPQSIVNVEDYRFYLNRQGYFGYGGGKPELVSNHIQPQIYNNAGSGIAGTTFDNAPSGNFKYDIYTAVGTVTDDLTNETINNALQVYNFQLNEWRNHDFANLPTAFHTYKDALGVEQFIFGDSTGQCYTYGGAATSDNTSPINATMQMVFHAGVPQYDKKWSWLYMFFNPGCEANIQIACENTFNKASKKWISVGQAKNGYVEFGFPPNTRSKLLFIKILESSTNAPFTYYGCSVDFTLEGRNR